MRIEIRSKDCAIIEGYVNVVGRRSRPLPSPHGRFIEIIEPGVFKRSLERTPNIELKYNHQRILGDVASGVLELREDNIGLYGKATVTDAEVIEKGRRGELTGWSFGFRNPKEKWEEEKRYICDLDLMEVSILDKMPAYPATSVEVRSNEITEYRSEITEETDVIERNQGSENNELSYFYARQQIEILKMKGKTK